MKKALVLALTAFMVLSLATAAFAVEVDYEGKVQVKWEGSSEKDGDPGFAAGDYEAFVNIDLTKDFGDGVSAGAKIKIDPTAKTEVLQDYEEKEEKDDAGDTKWYEYDFEKGEVASVDEVKLDGAGWIKIEKDLFAVTAKTEIDGGVGKAFGEYPISEKAGLGLDLFLIDGLTINSIVNGGGKDGYNFLVKGEYAADLFSIGGGYQKDAAEKTAFGVYGSADLIDGLTLNVEFGNRKEGDADAATAILASASYDGLLNATASFYTVKKAFDSIIDKADGFLARDKARFEPEYDFSVIFVDAAYNVTDALAIDGSFDYILNAKDENDKDVDLDDELSYKVGAAYTFDAFKVEGWYKAFEKSQVGGKATYTLAEGVATSFEVTSSKDKDADDSVLEYTLLFSAAF